MAISGVLCTAASWAAHHEMDAATRAAFGMVMDNLIMADHAIRYQLPCSAALLAATLTNLAALSVLFFDSGNWQWGLQDLGLVLGIHYVDAKYVNIVASCFGM